MNKAVDKLECMKSKYGWFGLLSVLIVLAVFLYASFYLYSRIDCLVTSDDVCHMVQGKVQLAEKSLICKNWFYSTQITIMGPSLFYALLFAIFSNWKLVRLLFTIITMFISLVAGFYVCKKMGSEKYYIPLSIFFCIPFSFPLFHMTLITGFYSTGILFLFIDMALMESYLKDDEKKKHLALAFSILLAFAAGCEGFRSIFTLYLPMTIAAAISMLGKRKSDWFKYSVVLSLSCLSGVVVNTWILAKKYTFFSWNNISFTKFSFAGIEKVINGLLDAFGYRAESVVSFTLIKNGVCAIWVLTAMFAMFYGIYRRSAVDEGYYRISLYGAVSFALYIILYSVTDMLFETRYLFSFVEISILLITSFIKQVDLPEIKKKLICIALVILTITGAGKEYQDLWKMDNTKEYRVIADKLVEEGYFNGYATFWRANVMTYLSNGQIDVWSVGFEYKDVHDINEIYGYLQLKSHADMHPTGKTFIIFSDKEKQNSIWNDSLNDENILIKTDTHIVYGYPSYEELIDDLDDN